MSLVCIVQYMIKYNVEFVVLISLLLLSSYTSKESHFFFSIFSIIIATYTEMWLNEPGLYCIVYE